MDPLPLNADQWADIALTIKFLWLSFASSVIGASALLTAHALIPSLVSTRTISTRWQKTRPVFYVTGAVGVVGIGVSIFLAAQQTDWIRDFYPRFWQ